MSVRTDQVNLIINVNGNQAQNQLNELKKRAADLAFELKNKLVKGTEEYIAKSKELETVKQEMTGLKQSIGLTALSQKELNSELNKLKSLRGSTVPFSNEYKEFSAQIKLVEKRLYDVKNGVQGFASFISKIKDEVKQFGVVALSYLGFQFISSQFQNIIRGAGKLSDQLADLQRVAGLTADEAKNLNAALSGIDTRTSTGGLRDIAIVAGKLGVAKEDIFSFTQAVDQLVVSLGDELGDANQITDQLGKILNVFDGKITGENITKLGNAFVELANTGSATGGFIADFDQRLSGIAKSAGISLGALSGLGAGLEEMGAKVESSSTAIQKLIISIASDIPKATKIANISVEEFAKLGVKSFDELFKKDPTEALLRYSQGLVKNKTSFAEITASFKDAGEEGARTIETITKLGGSADQLRKRIDLGKQSIQESTAITEAFALKNETFGATLDKLGKEFNKLVTSSAVTNFLKGAVEGVANFIKFLKDLPTFLSENRTAFIALTTIVFAYIAAKTKATQSIILNRIATLLMTAADKLEAAQKIVSIALDRAYAFGKELLTGKITLATAAQRLWNLALKANPLVLIISLIGALVTAISFLSSKYGELTTKARLALEIQKRVGDATVEEVTKINTLTSVIKDHNVSLDNRKKALEQLIAISPDYLKGLTLENFETAAGKKLIDGYIASLNSKAEAEARYSLLVEKLKERNTANANLQKADKELPKGTGAIVGSALLDAFGAGTYARFDEAKRKVKDLDDEISLLQADVNKDAKKNIQETLANINTVSDASGKALDNSVAARRKFLEDQITDLKKSYENLNLADIKGREQNLALQKKYQAELDALEGKDAKKSTAEKKQESEYERLKKEAEKFYKEIQQLKLKAQAGDLTDHEKQVEEVKIKYSELLIKASEFHKKNITSNTVYNEEVEIINRKTFQDIEILRKKFFEDDSDKEFEDSKKAYDEYFADLRDIEARNYAEGKISKQQYEANLKDIEFRELKQRIRNAEDYQVTSKKAAGELSKYKIDLNHAETKDLQDQQDKRLKLEQDEAAALKAIRDLQLKNASPALRKDVNIRDAKTERDDKIEKLKEDLQASGQAFDDETIKQLPIFQEAWATFNAKVKDANEIFWQAQVDNVLKYVQAFQDGLNSINTIISNKENKSVAQDKKNNDQKEKALKKQLDSKLISQKTYDVKVNALNEDQAKKERKVAHDQAVRDKEFALFNAIINTAAGVAKSFPNFVKMGIIAALGALEIAAIASQPVPEAAKGGVFNGPSHAESGMTVYDNRTGKPTVEVEGGEPWMVLSKNTLKNNGPVIEELLESSMHKNGAPVKWVPSEKAANGGVYRTESITPKWKTITSPQINTTKVLPVLANGGIVGSGASSRALVNDIIPLPSDPEVKEILTALLSSQNKTRDALNSFNGRLRSHVVLKDITDQEGLLNKAKGASSIN